jgi:hypothetical protein
MKVKHNKKRNTAFLYESLVTELTKSIVRKDFKRKQQVLEIIKKYFHNGSVLKHELSVYRSILESEKMSIALSRRFLFEVKRDYDSLDKKEIFNKQTLLIKEINTSLSNAVFSNFVSSYKDIGSLYQFFNSNNTQAKSRLILEQRVIKFLTSKKHSSKTEMKHIDSLTYNTFINKFNETYDKTLRQEQKDLLTNYITSFSDNGLGLKSFLNEEISRLKNKVNECLQEAKIKNNNEFLDNTNKVIEKLNSYKEKQITEDVVKEIFYIQDFVSEVLE